MCVAEQRVASPRLIPRCVAPSMDLDQQRDLSPLPILPAESVMHATTGGVQPSRRPAKDLAIGREASFRASPPAIHCGCPSQPIRRQASSVHPFT